MTLYKLSIERPVLATVMSIVIMIFGWVSYQRLGVREFPAVDPPIITVSTAYPGAAPEVPNPPSWSGPGPRWPPRSG